MCNELRQTVKRALTAASVCVQQWENILEKVSDCNVSLSVLVFI